MPPAIHSRMQASAVGLRMHELLAVVAPASSRGSPAMQRRGAGRGELLQEIAAGESLHRRWFSRTCASISGRRSLAS